MSEFITGAACSDITGILYSRIMEKIEDGKTATVIVPDQFVFETEKSLYYMCKQSGKTYLFKKISVRTISRISEEIVRSGSKEKPPADDIIKSVIMYSAIHDRQVNLGSLGRISKKSGFTSKMVKTVSLFKTAGIDPDKLMRSVGSGEFDNVPSLFNKLNDISLLYTEYDQMLGAKYTDKLDMTMRAAKIAASNTENGKSYFGDECVFVTGFNSFSASQLELMKVVAEKALYSCFVFIYDEEAPRDIFKTIKADMDILSGGNEDSTKITFVSKDKDTSVGIVQVSKLVYDDMKTNKDTVSDMSSVKIVRADDIYGEMEYIAAEIRRLVGTEGFRYKDIAVLCSDTSEYRTPAESAFSKYDIPVFCDIPEVILNAPLTNLILSLLTVLDEPTEQNILSYVRSSFLRVRDSKSGKFRRLSYREIDCFDGYIYRWKLNGTHFYEPFDTQNMAKRDRLQAEVAEEVRLSAVQPLLELRRKLTDNRNNNIRTGAWITKELCEFLYNEAGIENSVCYSDDNAATLWDILVKIFEAIYSAPEDAQMNIKQYNLLFRDLCAQTTLALPPQYSDCVLLGDTGRTRAEGIKVAFIAGANYGKFPDESTNFGLFSEYEAELLSENELNIALKREDNYHFSRYQAYRAMALPSKKLYLTYPLLNTACTALSPSETVTELLSIFPSLSVDYAGDFNKFGDDFYCSTKKALRSRYASLFGSDDEKRVRVLEKALELSGDIGYSQHLKDLVASRPTAYKHAIDPNTAENLFWNKTISATKLEKLCQCRFEYFCKEGLKIKERLTINAANTDVGSAVHYVLENVLRDHSEKMTEFFKLDRKMLSELSKRYLDDYREKNLGGSNYRSNSFNYMYDELTSRCADMLTLLQTEFACRKYRPVLFELSFFDEKTVPLPTLEHQTSGAPSSDPQDTPPTITKLNNKSLRIKPLELKISDDITVKIIGVVDRVDMFSSEEKTNGSGDYLRIVDYKTGGHSFKMSNALYGVNVQMLIYLIALDDANKTNGVNTAFVPGGVSYLPAKATEAGSNRKEGLLSLIAGGHYSSEMCVVDRNTSEELKQFQKGYVKAIYNFDLSEYAKNSSDISAADHSANSTAESDGAAQTVECTVSDKMLLPKNDAIPSPEQYQKLHDAVRDRAIDVLGKLYSGNVEAVPVIYTEDSAVKSECTFCRFKGVCGNQLKYGIVVDEGITEEKLGAMNNEDQTNLLSKPKKKASKNADDSTKKPNEAAEKPKRGRKAAAGTEKSSPITDDTTGGEK